MSGIYYRRWTRMYIQPAAKYFKKYDVLQPGMQQYMHMFNHQNPRPENRSFFRRMMVDHDEEINNKLIRNLFAKYPDLKYESVNRQKYHGDNFNAYSYSYAFITEQKKLMKAGYTMKKAFELVQQKFQEKMKRKIDQTLISRGLAIGNRARSLLTIYQQQVQYQSRLKMLRTKRQVLKYEKQLKDIQEAVNRPVGSEAEQETAHYERIFQKITAQTNEDLNQQSKTQKRHQSIAKIDQDFQNMFNQFYQIAAYKDRLRGLTDEEIKQQIMTSPQKIKRLSRQLVNYLKEKGGVSISLGGELKMSDSINENLKSFIYSSPSIKIALLNHLIGYESPQFSVKRKMETQAKNKLSNLKSLKIDDLNEQKQSNIKQNKLRDLQQMVQKEIPEDSRVYKLLQTSQERMLRLQIKYLTSFIKKDDKMNQNAFSQLKTVIQKFRRLKFRMEKRHKKLASNDLAFPQHYQFGKPLEKIQDINSQYEDLLQYLRKRTEQRRLKAIDIADDNKIKDMMKKQACNEIPKSQGQEHKHH